ncbi:DUF4197 domain-containing protein [Quisquiliibacterium transsilvanicum]|uniref:DUF4197 domain-containing protein n=1 Tax=Quisquiliibacterium transsilvanicum TaxID=1549638 RepID=A0A7W8HHU9_9BURK|nr:DUF4197 domain-containing protein [Quisquiliibacterium transsilvanicum]MBB5272334.1 hypothetical protein [Quisquiliibacterium transsilvanicum]
MKRLTAFSVGILIAGAAAAQLPKLDDVLKRVESLPRPSASGAAVGSGDARTDASGIKEALAVGTERAVQGLSRTDGYFANQAVKILMPSGIQKVAELARMAGYQKQVDAFVLSMNRAAEAAAPQAARFFGDAIRDMTLEDVRGILAGGDTAATEFFRRKTHDKLYAAFRPVVSTKVDEVGATRAYKDMISRYEKVPLAGSQSLDLDHYVTEKALDGLFLMVGEEEKKIRTNPLARSTELLKSVFGR